MEAFLRRGARSGLYPSQQTADEITDIADDKLFDCVLRNNDHVLHELLSKRVDITYNLRHVVTVVIYLTMLRERIGFLKNIRGCASYNGSPLIHEHEIDTELVSCVIFRLQNGKAPDVAGLTGEHLIQSHMSISVVLCKLFKIIMQCRYVPAGFRHGYIVPIPKVKDTLSKSMFCDDFRGIAISPIISMVFEHCVLDIFQNFFLSSDAQFGCKKGIGCRNPIYTVRTIVDRIVEGGNTVNNWLSDFLACVKWGNSWSQTFEISSGVRQGSVVSVPIWSLC